MAGAQNYPLYASVLLDCAVDKALDYGVPEALLPMVSKGVHVRVPLRGRLQNGYILALKESPSFPRVLPLHAVLSAGELIPEDLFALACWMSKYYCTPLRQVLKIILPSSVRKDVRHKEQAYVMRKASKEILRKSLEALYTAHPAQAKVLECMLLAKKGMLLTELLETAAVSRSPVETLVKQGLLEMDIVRVDRSPLVGEEYFKSSPKSLNSEQKTALDRILKDLAENRFATHLLFGVTGSGKTEVYLQAIEKALQIGKGTILIVPEISLTPQTIERFRSRFEGHIAVLHHRLSQGERYDEWHKIRRGEASIVIGARSAIFSPVKNLGLILVDEEHDSAYKQQEEAPCYHARDVAVMRGKTTQSVVVLGSATPSLESYTNAVKGKYVLSTLKCRVDRAFLPKITLVDMRHEDEKAKSFTTFSEILIEGIKKRASSGEQVILFLNRRGYHTTLLCTACGHHFTCPHCDVALTFHRGENTLACHLCDYKLSPPPTTCSQCKSLETLKYRGIGTEQVERALHAILPDVRTLRIDRDTTRHKGSHEQFFRAFSTGKADVLIGTQMIAKGLHFPGVTLVAILNSDSAFHIPDFRASEQAFSLITQVAGRAGRGEIPGEVIIQTRMPDNPLLQLALKHDFETFYADEIKSRTLFGFPPTAHLVKLTFQGEDLAATQASGQLYRQTLLPHLPPDYSIHPLVPSGHPKINNIYRFQLLIRGPHIYPICSALTLIPPPPKTVRLLIDVDPLSTFF